MQLSEIASRIGTSLPSGAQDRDIEAISSPEKASSSDITFLSNPKYREKVQESVAAAVIVKKGECIPGKICLEVDDPYVGYARTAQLFEDISPLFGEGISPEASVDSSAVIESCCSIGPGTVVGPDVVIAEQCRIGANCVIERGSRIGSHSRIDSGVVVRWGSRIGARVTVQSGAIIGSDGFGNAREKGEFIRIPAFGVVIIEDDADIGAGTTIDRGNFESTVISRGVKLDNLIHVAHNVSIGDNTAIAAQTGISGSTRIGKRVIIAGQVGFVGHIDIGDDAFVGAKAGVSKSVEPAAKITGYPARDLMTMRRIEAAQAQLPQLMKELKRLRKEVDTLKKAAGSV
ncbi:MAG: UDP-3-O-(3-hydroxymyristoyl)glucosamine N-acyltransferase [Chitinispirillaceae bacterium]